jgi:hypothetical protein
MAQSLQLPTEVRRAHRDSPSIPPLAGRSRRRRLRGALIGAAVIAVATLTVMPGPPAAAAGRSPFTVVNGTVGTATGTPVPASGTQASLWSNRSSAATTITGGGRVEIGAIGDYCRGWPLVRVSADGTVLGDVSIVDARRYGSYPVGTPLRSGRHRITVTLLNDLSGGGCDRNVHLGSARIGAAAATPPTTAFPPTPTPSAPAASARQPVVTAAGSVAGPANTGVPDGTALTVHNGDLTVTTAGAVIDAMDIRGFLKIEANDVTVKRSIIRGRDPGTVNMALVSAFSGSRNVTITDSTLRPGVRSANLDGLKGRGFTATRLDVSGTVDAALVFGDDVTIQDSWFHDTAYFSPYRGQPDNQTHNDAVQIEGGNHIRVTGNTLEGAHNSAVMITQNYARTTDLMISGNRLSGGGCTVNLSDKNKGPMQVTLQDNRFGPSRLDCAVVSPGTTKPSMTNNTFLATGAPVSLSRG